MQTLLREQDVIQLDGDCVVVDHLWGSHSEIKCHLWREKVDIVSEKVHNEVHH